MLKRILVSLVMVATFVVLIPLGTNAQTYHRPSFYRRHRNAVNVGASTLGGAIIGRAIGGRRGAGIGALAGAGGGALYSYKIRPKRRRY